MSDNRPLEQIIKDMTAPRPHESAGFECCVGHMIPDESGTRQCKHCVHCKQFIRPHKMNEPCPARKDEPPTKACAQCKKEFAPMNQPADDPYCSDRCEIAALKKRLQDMEDFAGGGYRQAAEARRELYNLRQRIRDNLEKLLDGEEE